MAVPLPLPNETTGFTELMVYTNTATGGFFGPTILFVIAFAFFFVFKASTDVDKAFAAASFCALLVAIPMRIMEVITNWPVLVFVILTMGSVAYMVLVKD